MSRPIYRLSRSMRGPEGRPGVLTPTPPLENLKAVGFLINIGPDPLENHKAAKPAFNVVPSSLNGVSLVSR